MKGTGVLLKAVLLSQFLIPISFVVLASLIGVATGTKDFVELLQFYMLVSAVGLFISVCSGLIFNFPILVVLRRSGYLEPFGIYLAALLSTLPSAVLLGSSVLLLFSVPLSVLGASFIWVYLRRKGALTSQGSKGASRRDAVTGAPA